MNEEPAHIFTANGESFQNNKLFHNMSVINKMYG